MSTKFSALAVALFALMLAACGAVNIGSGTTPPMSGATFSLPAVDPDIAMTATLPKDTIGEELPSEGVGSIKSTVWKALLGGFTQTERTQSLAFPPGTKITIRNLSKNITHTLDVVKAIAGAPAVFPANPTLSIPAKGDGKLEVGYASGPIGPGRSVTITLEKAGTYEIGCAFHYGEGMRDVLVVKTGAKPGPQATPLHPKATPTPWH